MKAPNPEFGWQNHGETYSHARWSRLKPCRLDNGLCWYGFDPNTKDNSYEGAWMEDALERKERDEGS